MIDDEKIVLKRLQDDKASTMPTVKSAQMNALPSFLLE
jgi:hypothetical protein